MDDLERMKAEFAAKGGKVTILPATEYESITSDELRLKDWGDTDIRKRKMREAYKDQVIFETGGRRDDE